MGGQAQIYCILIFLLYFLFAVSIAPLWGVLKGAFECTHKKKEDDTNNN